MSDLVLTNKQILMINLLTNQGRKTSLQRSCASSSTIWYQGVIGSMTPRLSVKLHRARLNQSQPNHVVLIFARVKQGGGGVGLIHGEVYFRNFTVFEMWQKIYVQTSNAPLSLKSEGRRHPYSAQRIIKYYKNVVKEALELTAGENLLIQFFRQQSTFLFVDRKLLITMIYNYG